MAALCLLTLSATAAQATDRARIRQAVDAGVAHLKKTQATDGTWEYPFIGLTALAGLTLLECGMVADDPALQKAGEAIRQASPSLGHTYSIALVILFLDLLDNRRDAPLLDSLTVRLLEGQTRSGGWGYTCPVTVGPEEAKRLTAVLNQQTPEKRPNDRQAQLGGRELAPDLQERLAALKRPGSLSGVFQIDDNSNTQFATLALWVARRHGLPVEEALLRVDKLFRSTQSGDGSWGYRPGQALRSPSMTCAGLLALAVGHGTQAVLSTGSPAKPGRSAPARRPPDPGKDPAIRKSLQFLGSVIGAPIRMPPESPQSSDYYTLWSIERVAVLLGLERIGRKDWYDWGAGIILKGQSHSGGWQASQGWGVADTCFALLFLQRVNLARDLTATLRTQLRDLDPASLAEGGTGAQTLAKREERPVQEQRAGLLGRLGGPSLASAAVRLEADLVGASPEEQDAILSQLRDGKGVAFTDALARAIPRLATADRLKGRDALAMRLARMTAATLRDKFTDDNAEVRRAAALACAMKEDQGFVSDLVGLLGDSQPSVARAAHVALTALTGQDFGPAADATARERERAQRRWREWWTSRKDRSGVGEPKSSRP
jgi:hypothetical protein